VLDVVPMHLGGSASRALKMPDIGDANCVNLVARLVDPQCRLEILGPLRR